MEDKELPFILRLEKAKNEFHHAVNTISTKYDLPGEIVDLILEGLLSYERKNRIALMVEQITFNEEEEDEHYSSKFRED